MANNFNLIKDGFTRNASNIVNDILDVNRNDEQTVALESISTKPLFVPPRDSIIFNKPFVETLRSFEWANTLNANHYQTVAGGTLADNAQFLNKAAGDEPGITMEARLAQNTQAGIEVDGVPIVDDVDKGEGESYLEQALSAVNPFEGFSEKLPLIGLFIVGAILLFLGVYFVLSGQVAGITTKVVKGTVDALG